MSSRKTLNWWDLPESLQQKLLEQNPDLEEAGGWIDQQMALAPGRVKKLGKAGRPSVDPEVARIMEEVRQNNERTIDLKLEAQRIAAETRLLKAHTQLKLMKRKYGSPSRAAFGHNWSLRSYWSRALFLFVFFYVALRLIGV